MQSKAPKPSVVDDPWNGLGLAHQIALGFKKGTSRKRKLDEFSREGPFLNLRVRSDEAVPVRSGGR